MFAIVDPATFALVEYRSFDTYSSQYGSYTVSADGAGSSSTCSSSLAGSTRAEVDGRYYCSLAMAGYLQALSASHPGYVVFVATYDEASRGLEETGYAALRTVLGSSLTDLRFRRMYALITTVGGTPFDEAFGRMPAIAKRRLSAVLL